MHKLPLAAAAAALACPASCLFAKAALLIPGSSFCPHPLPNRAGLPWAAVAAARQQPVSLSQGIAAAGLVPLPTPAAGGLVAPQQGGLLRQLEQLWADSVRRKRKRAMNKHKHRCACLPDCRAPRLSTHAASLPVLTCAHVLTVSLPPDHLPIQEAAEAEPDAQVEWTEIGIPLPSTLLVPLLLILASCQSSPALPILLAM